MSGSPRIAVVGGGSNQWTPKLVTDLLNSPTLRDAHLVLHDIDAARLPRLVAFAEHAAEVRRAGLTVISTTDLASALAGADFVVVQISTGGFDAMAHDLAVPARYGILQSVGDTIGPGGLSRTLRNVPVLVDIARAMEEWCPDAWLLNLTNPMAQLCRAVDMETSIKVAGVCHETTIISFFLSMLVDVSFLELDPTTAGVNHLTMFASARAGEVDVLERLRGWLADPVDLDAPLPFGLPEEGLGVPRRRRSGPWTKQDLVDINRVKLALFERWGVLPAAGDRHLVEFFPWFLHDEQDLVERWGVTLTSIEERRHHEARFAQEVEAAIAADTVTDMPSGETITWVIDSLLGGPARNVSLNVANRGQVADVGGGVCVESVCIVDGGGVTPRDAVALPAPVAEHVRRAAATEELSVAAALSGDRDLVVEALRTDPLAGHLSYERSEALAADLLAATAEWLPQFGGRIGTSGPG